MVALSDQSPPPVTNQTFKNLELASHHLRANAYAIERAAWKEGIDPDGPLGVFVTALRDQTLSSADMADAWRAELAELLQSIAEASRNEVKTLRLAVDEARAKTLEARHLLGTARLEVEKLEAKTIDTLSVKIAEQLHDAVIIREQGWNARRNLFVAGLFALVGFGLFCGGLAFDRYNQLLVMRDCLHQPIMMPNGRAYCDVTDMR